MFTGTTPPEVKVLLQELMGKIPTGEHVFIGCSGNYTTDKVMAGMGFAVHSNDVSLYSKLIADILLGEDTTPMICTDSDLKDVFVDAANGNFFLKEDSKVYRDIIGFEKWDYSLIGRQK